MLDIERMFEMNVRFMFSLKNIYAQFETFSLKQLLEIFNRIYINNAFFNKDFGMQILKNA